ALGSLPVSSPASILHPAALYKSDNMTSHLAETNSGPLKPSGESSLAWHRLLMWDPAPGDSMPPLRLARHGYPPTPTSSQDPV
ncbi:hypothetical protein P7K49_035471, partial [Saguinus oedipus]